MALLTWSQGCKRLANSARTSRFLLLLLEIASVPVSYVVSASPQFFANTRKYAHTAILIVHAEDSRVL